jgi:hypothetical protein
MNKAGGSIYLLLTGTVLVPGVLIAVFLGQWITPEIFIAWVISWLIVFTGFVFELLLIRRGLVRGDKSFIRNVLGAISVRLFCTLLLVYICLQFLELNQNNFIFSTFIFYFFYLFIEIFYLNFRKY